MLMRRLYSDDDHGSYRHFMYVTFRSSTSMSSAWTSTGPYVEVLNPEVAVQLPCAQGQINRLIKLGCEVEIMGNKLVVRSPSRPTGFDDQSIDESDKEIESQLSVAQGQIDKLNKLGADVDLLGGNTLVVRPSTGAQRLDIRAELLEGKAALDFLDNPEVADVVIVCGPRHFRAYTRKSDQSRAENEAWILGVVGHRTLPA